MRTDDFNFDLPEHLIAQVPLSNRPSSRLLVLNRETRTYEDKHFYDIINYFKPGDVVEFFGPKLDNTVMTVEEIIDYETKEKLEVACHPLQLLLIKVPFVLEKDDMMRKVNI